MWLQKNCLISVSHKQESLVVIVQEINDSFFVWSDLIEKASMCCELTIQIKQSKCNVIDSGYYYEHFVKLSF